MVELQHPVIILGYEPRETQFFGNSPEHSETLLAPRIEVACPDHWSLMILDRLEHCFNLPEKWFSKIEIHRMGIDDQEFLLPPSNIDETDSCCFRSAKYRFTIRGLDDREDFLSIFWSSEYSCLSLIAPEGKAPKKFPIEFSDTLPDSCPRFWEDRFLHEDDIKIAKYFFYISMQFFGEAFMNIPDTDAKRWFYGFNLRNSEGEGIMCFHWVWILSNYVVWIEYNRRWRFLQSFLDFFIFWL